MTETVLTSGLSAVLTAAPDIVGGGKGGSSVQQDLDDLVIIRVSSQNQRGDVGREGGGVGGYRLPALVKYKYLPISSVSDYRGQLTQGSPS